MDKILRGAQHFTIAHLDDFCIWSADWDSHVIRLREILTRLRKAKLTVDANKCQFAVKIKCLGYILDDGEIKPDEEKVEAIQNIKPAVSKTQIRQILGLTA